MDHIDEVQKKRKEEEVNIFFNNGTILDYEQSISLPNGTFDVPYCTFATITIKMVIRAKDVRKLLIS